MKSNTICYINSYSNKGHHEVFNAALLLALINFNKKMIVYTGRSSWQEINKKVHVNKESKLKVNFLYLPKSSSKIAIFFRYIISAFYNLNILLFSRKETLLIYNFNNPISLSLLNSFNNILKRKVLIFCHGELELLVNDEGGALATFLRKKIRHFFYKKNRKISLRFCVLGDSIIKNLNPIIGDKISKFISINHPYFFYKKNDSTTLEIKNSKLNIGTIGVLNVYKGLNDYIQLINTFSTQIKENINFYVIGNILEEKNKLKDIGIQIKGGEKMLSRKDFDKYISSLDYILFFYSVDKYRFTASGAIFDAIKLRIPIIALENTYFKDLFEIYGQIGYLCKNIDEMKNVIENIINMPSYQNNFAFDSYFESFSVKTVCADLLYKLQHQLNF